MPVPVDDVVRAENSELSDCPGARVTVLGVNVKDGTVPPGGSWETIVVTPLRLMVPWKLLILVRVMIAVAAMPLGTEMAAGRALALKSGAPTTTGTVTVIVSEPLVPVTVTL